MRPLAVVSHILPPSPSGQAVMLYRLFRNWDPKNYCLLSRENYSENRGEQGPLPSLPAQYYHLKAGFHLKGSHRFKILELFDLLVQTFQRAKIIVHIIKREKCSAIMACSGDLLDLPAGYLASRFMRVPFYAYIFDDYLYQWTKRIHRSFARHAEHVALKGATSVIVSNEFLSNAYYSKYRIEPTVIHNPYENPQIDEKSNIPWPASKDEIKIVYTGAIYHAHFDAFRNLFVALRQLDRTDIKLHLYTAQLPVELERENICGSIQYHAPVTPLKIIEVQKRADILFLPLAFDSTIPEVIKTSSPGKMGEYMASGRPILVHAPTDSFVSWYFKEHKCGLVVDQNNPEFLSRAISRILNNVKLREKLVVSARARAKVDFNLNTAQDKFLRLFQLQKGN
jgi:glycosyltransferase involved in cell wall biosynthesis